MSAYGPTAVSATPRNAERSSQRQTQPRQRLAVACSGGRDSTALLHCVAAQAALLNIDVIALHVQHGLMAQADTWLQRVQETARAFGTGFDSRKLSGQPLPGESVEAWARRGRYRALAEMAQAAGCNAVWLAHHRRDQAETWLLQALRGAGAAGLSAMPRSIQRGALTWARPWLDHPRQAIEAYVEHHRLSFVDDASNSDTRFARNRLRERVWPALLQAFPDAETALAAAAEQSQQAATLAAEVAAIDLPMMADGATLSLSNWSLLTPGRKRNALQAWLRSQLPRGNVPDSLVQRLLTELPESTSARWPTPGGELQLFRQRLKWRSLPPASAASLSSPLVAALPQPALPLGPLSLDRVGLHPVPAWRGRFEVFPVDERGVLAQRLQNVHVRARSGGERFSLFPKSTPRGLKKQFQAQAVPIWQREGPLLWTDDEQLLFVPALGMDARCWARDGEPALGVRWLPDIPG